MYDLQYTIECSSLTTLSNGTLCFCFISLTEKKMFWFLLLFNQQSISATKTKDHGTKAQNSNFNLFHHLISASFHHLVLFILQSLHQFKIVERTCSLKHGSNIFISWQQHAQCYQSLHSQMIYVSPMFKSKNVFQFHFSSKF